MAPLSGDGVLWLCLGISLFFAVRGIATDIRQVVDLTEIKRDEREDKIISEGTEEALKLDTLLKLSESTSHDLRAAALRIISERSTKGETRDILLADLSSKNKTRRGKAINALHFLVSNRALSRTSVCTRLRDLPTYTALVNCLCNFLDEHVEITSNTLSPILPRTRPLGEKKAIQILNSLLPENIPCALEAGVVSQWLTRYPFPCVTNADPSRRRDLFMLMKTWWADDAVMSSIFSTLTSHPDGIRQLRKHGLMGSMIEEENDQDDDDGDSDVWMVDGEDTAGTSGTFGSFRSAPRPQESSLEEQALRRRRREAMVLSEGGRPLGRDDIIQRPIQEG
ncbi:Armadillo-like helical [Penicillium chermesinum]|uniref:Armadillo-like helical n=1 Tax=Penicillium chermesinum TaxID=63820 RepID=A0A9W9PHK1_9EURO|nr:Armadillo-like helical [Penicillium chermesinum]KAJ5246994.1 Armadillo-like helical [Penicillium chermesinum]KAJ6145245.1 Armadillo-like helical [Penicillium chermesinum]